MARVSEFLAACVSSHYFSSLNSSLRAPTGASMMDRYILWGITGTKKEENHQEGSPSSIILFLFPLYRDYSHMELKGKPIRLINHTYRAQIWTRISVHTLDYVIMSYLRSKLLIISQTSIIMLQAVAQRRIILGDIWHAEHTMSR